MSNADYEIRQSDLKDALALVRLYVNNRTGDLAEWLAQYDASPETKRLVLAVLFLFDAARKQPEDMTLGQWLGNIATADFGLTP